MVERREVSQIVVVGGDEKDAARFVEEDFRIRSGMCPNGCGLNEATDYGQRCPKCGFFCNTSPELTCQ
jgi:hypothetical protein